MSAKENKALIWRYFEAIDRPDVSEDILDEFLDPELLGFLLPYRKFLSKTQPS